MAMASTSAGSPRLSTTGGTTTTGSPETTASLGSTNPSSSGGRISGRPSFSSLSTDLAHIAPSEIHWMEQIGAGNFGSVWRAKVRGKLLAVKRLKRKENNAALSEQELRTFEHEMQVMRKAYHPNCVMLLGFSTGNGGDELMMMTELLFSDLETLLIKQKRSLPLCKRLEMAHEAALGMNWLHLFTPCIIHRDLKLSNLLVDERLAVKVADFGLTRIMNAEEQVALESRPEGTPLYMAPEIFSGQFDEKCDVYSFGIVLWELIFCRHPYADKKSQMALIFAVTKQHLRPELPADFAGAHSALHTLLQGCWQTAPRERPTFAHIEAQLDRAVVASAVPDAAAAEFWHANFGARTEVLCEQFETAIRHRFAAYLAAADRAAVALRCVRALVSSSNESAVALPDWARLLARFGPLEGGPEGGLLARVCAVLSQPWFHGAISKEETALRLQAVGRPGAFLARFSDSPSADPRLAYYAVSYLNDALQVTHLRVAHTCDGVVRLPDRQFDSLADLVRHYTAKHVLQIAAPGSEYQQWFPQQAAAADEAVRRNVGAYGTSFDGV